MFGKRGEVEVEGTVTIGPLEITFPIRADNWGAPPILKAQMAFEIIYCCVILVLILVLLSVSTNIGSRHRQPYTLILVSAILLAISLLMDAVEIRIVDSKPLSTYLALETIVSPLWKQPTVLFTMAGLWIFRKRSRLVIDGQGARGITYAGQTWKFVVDWIVTSCSLLLLLIGVIISAVTLSRYDNNTMNKFDYERLLNVQWVLSYVQLTLYFILTVDFVITGFTLSHAFKRQTGKSDVVRRLSTPSEDPC